MDPRGASADADGTLTAEAVAPPSGSAGPCTCAADIQNGLR